MVARPAVVRKLLGTQIDAEPTRWPEVVQRREAGKQRSWKPAECQRSAILQARFKRSPIENGYIEIAQMRQMRPAPREIPEECSDLTAKTILVPLHTQVAADAKPVLVNARLAAIPRAVLRLARRRPSGVRQVLRKMGGDLPPRLQRSWKPVFPEELTFDDRAQVPICSRLVNGAIAPRASKIAEIREVAEEHLPGELLKKRSYFRFRRESRIDILPGEPGNAKHVRRTHGIIAIAVGRGLAEEKQ